MDESYSELKNGNFVSAKTFSDFSDQIKARNDEEADYLLRLKFNRCIALKNSKDEKNLKIELDKIDVSTSAPTFKLAYAILSGFDSDTIKKLLIQCKKLEKVSLEKYLEWPLFSLLKRRRKLNKEIVDILSK